ncbi:hypothetical protein Pmani_006158 [Petrolisthes manimaculis]|uniref:Uncharacterized protein n=1 Tax=Petrolisthes manimaculis TaxID=1843537 RepID=A0AAE1QAE1_9EUCA|nr:hypothetical protein Pmani_006158 [Petrolisthes manimaculis]
MGAVWRCSTYYTSDQKFEAVLRALPYEMFDTISSILMQDIAYDTLKEVIIVSHGMTGQQYLKVLEDVLLKGRRPSALLRHMQQLNNKAGKPFTEAVTCSHAPPFSCISKLNKTSHSKPTPNSQTHSWSHLWTAPAHGPLSTPPPTSSRHHTRRSIGCVTCVTHKVK